MSPIATHIIGNAIVQANSKENINAPHYFSSWGEFIGDWWISFTNGQCQKRFFFIWKPSSESICRLRFCFNKWTITWTDDYCILPNVWLVYQTRKCIQPRAKFVYIWICVNESKYWHWRYISRNRPIGYNSVLKWSWRMGPLGFSWEPEQL